MHSRNFISQNFWGSLCRILSFQRKKLSCTVNMLDIVTKPSLLCSTFSPLSGKSNSILLASSLQTLAHLHMSFIIFAYIIYRAVPSHNLKSTSPRITAMTFNLFVCDLYFISKHTLVMVRYVQLPLFKHISITGLNGLCLRWDQQHL